MGKHTRFVYIHGAARKCWSRYKGKAKYTGRPFKLSERKFLELTQSNCYYCGVPPQQTLRHLGVQYVCNGIDRLDNTKGYTDSNVVACCKTCNRFKLTMQVDSFLAQVKRIYENLCLGG